MGDMVIRDAASMESFATELDGYQEIMTTTCKAIQSAAYEAQQFMRDASGNQAVQRIDRLMDDMLAGLPVAEELALKLRKSAAHLNNATSIKF